MKTISHKNIVAVKRERESYTLVKQSIASLMLDFLKIAVEICDRQIFNAVFFAFK